MAEDNEPTCTTDELPPLKFAPGDWEANYNARNFIEETLTTNPRIKVTDAGVGGDGADLGITIDGAPFSIKITPRPLLTDKAAYPEGDEKDEVPCGH